MSAVRLDVALVNRGLARSRSVAVELIRSGHVTVAGTTVIKPSVAIMDGEEILVEGADHYVSRGAHKLLAAFTAFDVQVGGKDALDLGASTGGFTQVLLERGARSVIALDVGHDQLVSTLRSDERVVVVEGFNVRELTRERLHDVTESDVVPTLVVGDLSFISLQYVFGPLRTTAAEEADVILLVKPQFEVGRAGVREGIVRDKKLRLDALERVLWAAWDHGYRICGLERSPLIGTHGNEEYLVHMRTWGGSHPTEWMERAQELVGGVG